MNHRKKIIIILLSLCLIMGLLAISVGAVSIIHEHNDWIYEDCTNSIYRLHVESCPWEGHYGGGVNHPYGCCVHVSFCYTVVRCRICDLTFFGYEDFVHACNTYHTKTFLITHPCPY